MYNEFNIGVPAKAENRPVEPALDNASEGKTKDFTSSGFILTIFFGN